MCRSSCLTLHFQQYKTSEGNIPTQVFTHAVQTAPSRRGKSGYPREYGNKEGPFEDPRKNFEDWERRGADVFHEVPTTLPHREKFDFEKRKVGYVKMQAPIHPKDRARVIREPRNDPGALRAITDSRHQHVYGVNYHPPGDTRGNNRAPLEPLDRQGRMILNQHNDQRSSQGTWPTR